MKPMVWLLAAAAVSSARADVVTDWDSVLLDAIRATSTNPPPAARAMAMVHAAMFDAVNGIIGGYEPYMILDARPHPGASPEAAAAGAAHGVLSALFPARQPIFDAALAGSLAGIPKGHARKGLAFGRACSDAMLALRAHDDSDLVMAYTPGSGPGVWVPTPPAFAPALLPNWPLVTTFCMTSGSEFRSPGPPALDSPEYAAAFNQVKALGAADSTVRTADQTQVALFWADGAGTATPPGHWLVIARGLSEDHHLTLIENARLFALVSIAVGDAAIVAWDSKFEYNVWRPITAIRAADTDGNPATDADPAWSPLLVTPPFPSYTSGHSTFSGAASAVLAAFFGTDSVPFTTTSDALPGVTRAFASLSQAADEAGLSRIYGGIHYPFDNADGLASGRALGTMIVANFLRPADERNVADLSLRRQLLDAGVPADAADAIMGR